MGSSAPCAPYPGGMARPVHFEIHAEQPERAVRFYETLFGWKFSQWGDQPYWIIVTGEDGTPGINGGLMPRHGGGPEEMQAVNAFVCTVDVEQLDDSVSRALELGGVMAMPRMPVPGVGWLAYVKDTEGNILGMLEADEAAA